MVRQQKTQQKMLDTLITSKTRIKLLLKFFLNGKTSSYLRNLESEFGESSNAIRIELNKFEEAGLLKTATEGNKKLFQANTKHPLFSDIQNILMKYTGLDHIIEHVIQKLGDVEEVYLVGELAKGINSPIIDLVFVGNVNKTYLIALIDKAEKLLNKKIRYVIYANHEKNKHNELSNDQHFLLWSR
ncbi:MAG: ArsR family transcriptional regulator [Bacteroidia bacterium]|nr:ArsR family transcriptional regulator [Bacteroidia bacterium]